MTPEAVSSVPSSVVPRPPPPRPPTAARSSWAGMVIGAFVGGAAGYFGIKFGGAALESLPGATPKLTLLAALPVAWLLAVAVHELGHLVGGWSIGGRFMLISVGPIKLQRTPAGLRWSLNRSLNLFGGLAVCLPTEPSRLQPAKVAVMVLAGPAFSGLLALAAWGARDLALVGFGPGLPGAWVGALWWIVGALSALITVVTLWPSAAGGFKSDGKRAAELLQRGPRADQEAALLLLSAAELAGTRPAHYDAALVARATALRDGSLFDRYASLIAYYHHADGGRWAEAQAALDYLLAGETLLAPALREVARCEYAWLLATRTGDAVTARAWLDTARSVDFDPATPLRAEAAVLAAEGRMDEAAAKVQAARHALLHRSLSATPDGFALDALQALIPAPQPEPGR